MWHEFLQNLRLRQLGLEIHKCGESFPPWRDLSAMSPVTPEQASLFPFSHHPEGIEATAALLVQRQTFQSLPGTVVPTGTREGHTGDRIRGHL